MASKIQRDLTATRRKLEALEKQIAGKKKKKPMEDEGESAATKKGIRDFMKRVRSKAKYE